VASPAIQNNLRDNRLAGIVASLIEPTKRRYCADRRPRLLPSFGCSSSCVRRWYPILSQGVGPEVRSGHMRALLPGSQFTTTIDQIALAFTSPANLPPAGVYQNAIQAELENMRNAEE